MLFRSGRFAVARHLELLRQAGFGEPVVLAQYEANTENPTAAQNYACLMAVR